MLQGFANVLAAWGRPGLMLGLFYKGVWKLIRSLVLLPQLGILLCPLVTIAGCSMIQA